jgi:phosphoglycolate phosphatase
VIEFVLARLDIRASSDVVMVGDRSHDVVGARKVGLSCIGVTWGYAAADELCTAGALWLASDPAELLAGLIKD